MVSPTEITEIQQGRDSDFDEAGARRYHRVFRIAYNQATAGPAQAIVDQLVRRYDVYQEPGGFIDEAALAIKASAAPEDPETCFNHLVTIYYSTRWWDEIAKAQQSGGVGATGPRPQGGGGGSPESNSPANPLARPPVYSWGRTFRRKLFLHDYDPQFEGGRTLRTSARVPFDPPLETEESLLNCTVERNTTTYNELDAEVVIGTVNKFDFKFRGKVWFAGFVKCEDWTAKSEYENGVAFWAERIVLVFNRGDYIPNRQPPELSGWRRVVLDAGLHQLANDGKPAPIILRGGFAISKPWPLDGLGKMLPEGYADKDLVYKDYYEFPQTDFGIFGPL